MSKESLIAAIQPRPLPYEKDRMFPFLSKDTLFYHYEKHYLGYIQKLHDILRDKVEYKSEVAANLEELVILARRNGDQSVFNNAAQIWNHEFYFASMSPERMDQPEGFLSDKLKKFINDSFGSFEK